VLSPFISKTSPLHFLHLLKNNVVLCNRIMGKFRWLAVLTLSRQDSGFGSASCSSKGLSHTERLPRLRNVYIPSRWGNPLRRRATSVRSLWYHFRLCLPFPAPLLSWLDLVRDCLYPIVTYRDHSLTRILLHCSDLHTKDKEQRTEGIEHRKGIARRA
jgi:hypothetical protein